MSFSNVAVDFYSGVTRLNLGCTIGILTHLCFAYPNLGLRDFLHSFPANAMIVDLPLSKS
jgi:hypothetical protein